MSSQSNQYDAQHQLLGEVQANVADCVVDMANSGTFAQLHLRVGKYIGKQFGACAMPASIPQDVISKDDTHNRMEYIADFELVAMDCGAAIVEAVVIYIQKRYLVAKSNDKEETIRLDKAARIVHPLLSEFYRQLRLWSLKQQGSSLAAFINCIENKTLHGRKTYGFKVHSDPFKMIQKLYNDSKGAIGGFKEVPATDITMPIEATSTDERDTAKRHMARAMAHQKTEVVGEGRDKSN